MLLLRLPNRWSNEVWKDGTENIMLPRYEKRGVFARATFDVRDIEPYSKAVREFVRETACGNPYIPATFRIVDRLALFTPGKS